MRPSHTIRPVLSAVTLAAALGFAAAGVGATCTAGPPLVGAVEQTPTTEFVVLANGTAVHPRTRLVWKRCAEGQAWDGASCSGSVLSFSWDEALSRAGSATDAGSSDWRVPNRKELESIVEFCGHSPAINQTVFAATPFERFWTSTAFQADTSRAWDVYFSDGYVGASYKSTQQHLRLVRTLAPSDLPLAQSLSVGSLPTIGVGGSGNVVVTASSGLPVTLSNSTSGICSLSAATVTGLAVGACLLNANQAGDATFAPAPTLAVSLDVSIAAQAISFGAVPVLTVGGSGTISASSSSGLPVSLSAITPATCSLTGSAVRGIAVGTCTIAADQSGSALFSPAVQVRQNIVVSASATSGGGDTTPPPAANVTIALVAGWNLVGNGSDTAFAVDDLFGQDAAVASVWKWVLNGNVPGINYPTWAFHTPTLLDKGQAIANSKGFEWLSTIEPGEAFWVNAKTAFSVSHTGVPLPGSNFTPVGVVPTLPNGGPQALGSGWSLVSIGEALSPAQFLTAIGGPASDVISLWSWKASMNKWLFYSPELDARGGTALLDYATQKGYLDFQQSGTSLLPGSGFWVNRR